MLAARKYLLFSKFSVIVIALLLLPFLLVLSRSTTRLAHARQSTLPSTGQAVPGMESYDQLIPALMAKWQIPGGAVAVARNGRLVFARGYGYADREANQLAQPDSLFRIASTSKPITAAAIYKLVEDGKLDLDAKVFSLLKVTPLPGASVDSRLADITVRQLLLHSGGWNRDTTFDPMFISRQAAQAAGVPPPADAQTIMRYMQGQPLQFTPGTNFNYSNYGYTLLGRVIEKVTGQSYEAFVREKILRPAGVNCMRIGRSLLADRVEREVRYYHFPGGQLAQSVFPLGPASVPWPYGGFYLEAMDANGAWIASPVDLLRFMTAVDGLDTRPDVLQAATLKQMVARPSPPLWVGWDWFYSTGWFVRPINNEANWWHGGSMPGTSALLVRTYHGLTWAAVFNSRPSNPGAFDTELDNTMWQAFNGVTAWPTYDLFPQFTGCVAPGAAASVSAASYDTSRTLAPDSIASAFGTDLATSVRGAERVPLPQSLAGTRVQIRDSAGVEHSAPLFFVSPQQVNYLLPAALALGMATVTIIQYDIPVAVGDITVAPIAPGLFGANADGQGVAAAAALRVKADGMRSYEPVARFDPALQRFVAIPLDLGAEDEQLFLELYATGIRKRSSLAAVRATLGGETSEVLFAGATPQYVGLDQINVRMPRTLSGRGEVEVRLTVDGKTVNPVKLLIK
jgi:N-acyl-D-amino-acid deacylase